MNSTRLTRVNVSRNIYGSEHVDQSNSFFKKQVKNKLQSNKQFLLDGLALMYWVTSSGRDLS